jgi:hypothetical protein
MSYDHPQRIRSQPHLLRYEQDDDYLREEEAAQLLSVLSLSAREHDDDDDDDIDTSVRSSMSKLRVLSSVLNRRQGTLSCVRMRRSVDGVNNTLSHTHHCTPVHTTTTHC